MSPISAPPPSTRSARRGIEPERCRAWALGLLLSFPLLLSSGTAWGEPAAKDGWFYIHKYVSDRMREQYGGIATAPIFIFSETGALIRSGNADGSQTPGKQIQVPAGTYYVAAGKYNLGLTRQKYLVRPGKITLIQTGFVQIETWPADKMPRRGCSPWDAEMTLYDHDRGMNAPIFSNSRGHYGTKHYGMIQMLVGKYRLGWHGFDVPVEIRSGQILRVPLGTVGPLADPKGRISRTKEDTSDNASLRMCDDDPTHVLAGTYWVSYAKPLDNYPYEEREWQQVQVTPINEPGYDSKKLGGGEAIRGPVLTGPDAEPVPAPTESDLSRPAAATASPTEADPLGSDIQWNAPP